MRVWDIHPGYLNDQSLLGEHREIHGILSILIHNKKGYRNHPETKRWEGHIGALRRRHDMVSEEMGLRGFRDKTPTPHRGVRGTWPDIFIDSPAKQFKILNKKYIDKKKGRIPLPRNPMELWAQHKYSVMARDPNLYISTGEQISKGQYSLEELSTELVKILRAPGGGGGGRAKNALDHMWGYVSKYADGKSSNSFKSETQMLAETRRLSVSKDVKYLIRSTALADSMVRLC